MTPDTDQPGTEENVVSGYYEDYKQTQAEIFSRESRRVRNSLFWIGSLLFIGDLIGLAITQDMTGENLIYSLIFPLIFVGLGLLALKQPLLADILGIVVFIGIIILSIVAYGGLGAISGLLVKGLIIYLLLAGFQSAKTAEQAKKEMK